MQLQYKTMILNRNFEHWFEFIVFNLNRYNKMIDKLKVKMYRAVCVCVCLCSQGIERI